MSIAGALLGSYQQAKAARALEDYYMRRARTHGAYLYARNWLRGKSMADEKKHEGLPVKGYKSQGEKAVAIVNGFKEDEERVLRTLDTLKDDPMIDKRWLAIGRTQLEQAFMAINRSVFAPERVKLDEDKQP